MYEHRTLTNVQEDATHACIVSVVQAKKYPIWVQQNQFCVFSLNIRVMNGYITKIKKVRILFVLKRQFFFDILNLKQNIWVRLCEISQIRLSHIISCLKIKISKR